MGIEITDNLLGDHPAGPLALGSPAAAAGRKGGAAHVAPTMSPMSEKKLPAPAAVGGADRDNPCLRRLWEFYQVRDPNAGVRGGSSEKNRC
jgi:hypothetical protein